MKDTAEILRLVEISRLYYEDGLTQAGIAKKLNISRPVVSKLLSEARLRGIVNIEIKSPFESNQSLLQELSKKYTLDGGLIVQTGAAETDLKQRMFVSQASKFIENELKTATNVGLSWGADTGGVLDQMSTSVDEGQTDGNVCPLMGSAPNDIKWFQTNELTRIFGNKTGYTPYYLPAPAFPMYEENKHLFEQTNEYQIVSSLWSKLDLVILGIGVYPSVPDQATAARFGDKLREERAVGMIASYYYDQTGWLIESENDIVIRIPLKLLQKVKKTMAIGRGLEKVKSIAGALNTGLITHLITDEETALKILNIS